MSDLWEEDVMVYCTERSKNGFQCWLRLGHSGPHERKDTKGCAIGWLGVGDPVQSPKHYLAKDMECIDAIRAALGPDFICYCQGNVLKYTWRAQRKDNTKQDMAKAAWYAMWASGQDPREETPNEEKP